MNPLDKRAAWVVSIGVLVALVALYGVPQIQPKWLAHYWPVYSSTTANAASTISGILSPIISLATLIVVYLTLRAQVRVSSMQNDQLKVQQDQLKEQQEQFRIIGARQNNENFFDLTYRIVERFNEAVERQQRLFLEVPQVSLDRRTKQETSEIEGGYRPARQGEFLVYQQQFFNLTEFFSVISRRIDDVVLSGIQKLVLLDLIDVGYGNRIRTAIVEYQRLFREQELERRPEEMHQELTEQNVLIFQLRQRAEAQASIERIPFGDA